jgi:Cu-Zn family superoxide dismutase
MKTTGLFSLAIVMVLAPVDHNSWPDHGRTEDAQGKSVGTAVLWSKGASSGVSMELKLTIFPGEHALHFHQKAQCDAPDFKSAGPHFNPEGRSMA